MYNFKFIEHTADIAVDLMATTIEELFICAANAWKSAIYEGDELKSVEIKNVELKADTIEELLVGFLSEVNYFLLTKKWFCISVSSLLIKQNTEFQLRAELKGVNVKEKTIELNEEIKAVTYHQLKIEKIENEFRTRIVFDI